MSLRHLNREEKIGPLLPQNIIIVGCGFLGKAAAQLFEERGDRVLGIIRHETLEEAHSPAIGSFERIICDVTNASSVKSARHKIATPDLMIYAVSSNKGGPEAYEEVYVKGLQRSLETWRPKRSIFVSSTSVYAQTQGEHVTETSPTLPERETSQLLLEAEKIALNAGGLVARFAGIYGPGRSVYLKKFLNSTAVLEKEKPRWINQIHRDDGARALLTLASLDTQGTPPGLNGSSRRFSII